MAMAEYQWTKKADTEHFTVMVAEPDKYGYFEHHTLGDNKAGGLWFEPNDTFPDRLELSDFDGVTVVPTEVLDRLKSMGFVVQDEFYDYF